MTKVSKHFSFRSEHTKQLGREGMNKLTKKALRKATTVVRSIVGCTPNLFSLLVLVAVIVFNSAPAALAQGTPPGQSGAKQNGQTVDSNEQSIERIIRDYDDRHPYQAAQRSADSHTSKIPGTNLDKSDPGSPRVTPVYMPVYNSQGYMQPLLNATNTTKQARDNEIYQNTLTTFGMPLSDTQFQMINRENNQRKIEQMWDPEKAQWMTKATAQMVGASASNSMAGTAEQSFGSALDRIVNADGGNCLINVANEASGAGYPGMVMYKTIPEAVGMVQRMYKQVFIPMAILFLLPGAVASQVKGQIGRGFNLGYAEGANPFEGIFRSIVAVFLIPATQVIVSWSIDAGNSMAMSVRPWVDTDMIQDWANELSYNTKHEKDANYLKSTPHGSGSAGGGAGGTGGTGGTGGAGSGLGGIISGLGSSIGGIVGSWLSSLGAFISGAGIGTGLGAQVPEGATVYEEQGALSQVMQLNLNMMMNTASIFLVILGAYQLVMICYLLLLGPLAAAFYAWPQVTGSGKLFRNVFGSWVEAVLQVSLWRFYWMVVLAVITQRLIYTNGGTPDLQWEVCMFTCFLGILLWAPSSPFSFGPRGGLEKADKLAQDNKQGGGGGGGKGGGKGGAGDKGESGAPGSGNKENSPTDGQGEQQNPVTPAPATEQTQDSQTRSTTNPNAEQKTAVTSLPPAAASESGATGRDASIPASASGGKDAPPPVAGDGKNGQTGGNGSGNNKLDVSSAPAPSASAESKSGGATPPSLGANNAVTPPSAGQAGGAKGAKTGGSESGSESGKGNTAVAVPVGSGGGGGGGGGGGNVDGSGSASASVMVQQAGGQVQSPPPKEKKEEPKTK
ncbi:MAG: hypothetical protein QG574_1499 [Cyanobacteriota bacterium erpe_2018_sw_21hr_WHONDRS-SW48-000092_B_bin.40]|jgi:hypothetical protein|nr:hypothetical protein [Cyanobacteriota bacterium erpe_2018_sw_21hr_WHONDRS-SW48-000092_B_bin.40]